VEAVATADVEDRGVEGERAGGVEQPAGLEPAPHLVDEAEPVLVELERVIMVRVDRRELGTRGPRVEVDDAAAVAADGQVRIGRRPVLEVLTDTDRFRVARAADAAAGGLERQRPRPGRGSLRCAPTTRRVSRR
jgi:hypothetical protein